MCMPFCCDDCVYFNILTCLVSRNLDKVPNICQILQIDSFYTKCYFQYVFYLL